MDSITDEQLRKMTTNYFGMISLVDHNVGRILSVLNDEGMSENTIIVFTSDHGDLLGDHGLYQKGPMPYEGLINVGAIISGPDIPAGQRISEPVSTLDLAATFYDYADTSSSMEIQSRTLRPLLEKRAGATRDFALCEWRVPPYRMGIKLDLRIVRTKQYKLAVDLLSGAGELYDLKGDPLEKNNRYNDPEYTEIKMDLRRIIDSRPGTIMDPLPEHVAPGAS